MDYRKLFIKVFLIFLLYMTSTCFAFYADGDREVPLEAMLGDKKSFVEWRSPMLAWHASQLDAIKGFVPQGHKIVKQEYLEGVTLRTIQFNYPKGTPLYQKLAGGILALPPKINPSLPVIIALHGHEHGPWGQYPIGLFAEHKWPWDFVKKGYVVWAPVSMYHEEIKPVAEQHGYLMTWTKLFSDNFDYAKKSLLPKSKAGYAVVGLSAGGASGAILMAYRSDISVGVFAGADQDLDFLRRQYRIKGHPECWDVKGIFSYTAIQALIAPRPIQFQLGKQDPFYPKRMPIPKVDPSFSGTTRPVLSSEIGGNALILRAIYTSQFNSRDFSYVIHNGGHEMLSSSAMTFIEKHIKNSG